MQQSAIETRIVLERWFSILEYPVVAQSDNGKEFINKLVNALMEDNGVEYRHGQPYKPTTQGVVERANRTLKQRIAKRYMGNTTH